MAMLKTRVARVHTVLTRVLHAAPKHVVKIRPFDKPRIYGDDTDAVVLLDGNYLGTITRVMQVNWTGMSRTYTVDSYSVELDFPDGRNVQEHFDTQSRPNRKQVTAREALKAAKDFVRAEVSKYLGTQVSVESQTPTE